MSSNVSTPDLEPQSQVIYHAVTSSKTAAAAATSPLATNEPLTQLDDIPPLTLDVLTKRDDKVDALELVADSVAQQRQVASLSLVFHPVCMAGLVAALGTLYQFVWATRRDLGMLLSLGSGVIMAYLIAIRYAVGGYLNLAEQINWEWLRSDEDEEDLIIGTRFGDQMVGALVLRLEPNSQAAGKKKGRALSLKGGRGVIRAWTTRLRYRGRGIGGDLLHEAVRVTRERCGKDAEVGFAKEHANSGRVLWEYFNKPFRRQEVRAAKALEAVLAEWEGNRRKR